MKKKLFILFILLSLFVLVGCSQENKDSDLPGQNEEVGADERIVLINEVNRKIIYEVRANMASANLPETVEAIRNNLESDEWFDSESISEDKSNLIIRIKSSRLDTFITSLSEYGEVSDYNKTGTDISLQYQDYTNRITSLEAELARLNELYKEASITDMITINKRMSEINQEITTLTGAVNEFDSLVEYSTVYLSISGDTPKSTTPFGQSIKTAFTGGWKALVSFFKVLILVVSAILPFMIIVIPVGGISYYFYRKNKKNKND
jgi:uncharacterized protein YcfL